MLVILVELSINSRSVIVGIAGEAHGASSTSKEKSHPSQYDGEEGRAELTDPYGAIPVIFCVFGIVPKIGEDSSWTR